MCLIIFTPNLRRATIRKAVLERGFDQNSDGAGFAFVRDGLVVIEKGYVTFDAFWEAFRAARPLIANGPVLIHFRWTSVGATNLANTQPLVIQPNHLIVAHNGTISHLRPEKGSASDSVQFARLMARTEWVLPFTPIQRDLIKAIADDSRLVFLSSTGQHHIVNEDAGKWVQRAWYSDGGDVFKRDEYRWKAPKANGHAWSNTAYRSPMHGGDDFGGAEDEALPTVSNRSNPMYAKPPIGARGGLGPRQLLKRHSLVNDPLKTKAEKLDIFWAMYRENHGVNAHMDPDLLSPDEWRVWQALNNLPNGYVS